MTVTSVALGLFLCSLGFLLYVLFIYPLILHLVPAHRPGSRVRAPQPRSVSVILAVRDGEKWLAQKLESIFNLRYPRDCMQVIVISDGSTDSTVDIGRQFTEVEVISIPPSGKAAALNHGIERARNEILFFTDVRQDLEPASLQALIDAFDDPEVGVATGELIIRKGHTTEEENVGLYWRYEKWIRKRHSQIDSVLGATGAIYAIRRNLTRRLQPNTLLDDVYLPMAAFLDGYRIVFVEGARAYDMPTALDAEFRRKVRTQAGIYQLICHLPQLLGPGNRMWIHFLSHKVGRALLPFSLIAMLFSSFFLPSPWVFPVVAAQIAFYAIAALDRFIPEAFPLKRVSSLARTFVVLMAAAACAPTILFRPTETFWKTPTKSSA